MMFSNVFRWFCGIRTFLVDRVRQKDVAALLVDNGIIFRSVNSSKDVFRFKVFGDSVGKCERLLEREEIPFLKERYRGFLPAIRFVIGRPGLILGAIFFFLLNWFSSQLVWDIRVNGNDSISKKKIEEILEDCGFSYGTYIPGVDFDSLHACIMARYPDVAWISVNVSGTVADVQIRETKYDDREKVNDGVYSNLIASEDGRLVEFRVDGGSPVRSPGDIVKKGQLLVSGVVPLRDGGSRFSDPTGEVLAEVEKRVSARAELVCEKKVYTGREINELKINFFKKKINLSSNCRIGYERYDKIESAERLTLFGSIQLPVWISRTGYAEYVYTVIKRTPQEAIDEALSVLRNETDLLVEGAELLRKTTEVDADADGVSVSFRVTVLKNIAEKREFTVDR